jgi:hypothetical protein
MGDFFLELCDWREPYLRGGMGIDNGRYFSDRATRRGPLHVLSVWLMKFISMES